MDVNFRVSSELEQLLTYYSEAVSVYNIAVSEMVRLQSIGADKDYQEAKILVADARMEASRTLAVLNGFRKCMFSRPY